MNYKTQDQLIAFEDKVKALFANGELPFLVHLCGGNEDELINIFRGVQEGDWIFSTHRNAYHALLAGVPEGKLLDLIKNGRSMFVFDKSRNFYSSSVLAGTCCIAAGVAWQLKQEGSKNRVWCFLGDGAEDEGHFYEAARYVEANKLPCTFIIEDNNRSVDTPTWEHNGRAEGLDEIFECVQRYYYTPTYPHAGAGLPPGSVKFKPEIVEKFAAG